jgi:menaquinone-dependent protoporphyrinogen oxidase
VTVMSRVLITYGTTEGQSGRIAEYLAAAIRDHGHQVDTAEVGPSQDATLETYDAVVVGASVHMGRHDGRVVGFVRRNLGTLERMPSAFFSVSLASHGDTDQAEAYVEEFRQQTRWRPDRVARFAGALPYTRYGFLKRRLMKLIVQGRPGNLGTDLARDYVYTDWDQVHQFAEDVAADLADDGRGRLLSHRFDDDGGVTPR